MSKPTEDEIVKRVIRSCAEGPRIECRLWKCQLANSCQKHDYQRRLGELMTALNIAEGNIQ